jgi:hypothetical protein
METFQRQSEIARRKKRFRNIPERHFQHSVCTKKCFQNDSGKPNPNLERPLRGDFHPTPEPEPEPTPRDSSRCSGLVLCCMLVVLAARKLEFGPAS